jgi:hypothetical protein
MSKKSRRARARRRNLGQPPRATQSERPQVSKLVPASKTLAPSVELAPFSVKVGQHQYVLSELKLIGIIAGALFLVLIVLTFVLG